MTTIEITTENSMEMYHMLNLIKRMEAGDREPVHTMRKEANLHNIRPDPVQTKSGLGDSSEKHEKAKEEEPYRKLIIDLRANAEWLSDDMPVPEDLKDNILKAASLLEIEQSRRMIVDAVNDLKNERVAEVFKWNQRL